MSLKVNALGKAYEVYGLISPYSNDVMYVGVSTIPLRKRLTNHCSRSKTSDSRVDKWIRCVLAAGKRPVIKPLPFCTESEAIDHYGFNNLLNVRRAGGGRAHAAKPWPPEFLARLGQEYDHDLARDMGVSTDKVSKKRRDLGIESYRDRMRRERHEEREGRDQANDAADDRRAIGRGKGIPKDRNDRPPSRE